MLAVDVAMGTLTIPIWAAGAVCAVLLALAILAIGRTGTTASINVLFRVAIVAIAVSVGWVYLQRMERQEYAAEIRSLDERSAALVAGAVAPGSALPCLDEIAGEAVAAACEKAVFANAETVAAAVSYVAAKLAVLAERSEQARRAEFGTQPAPLLAALDTDRFGIVAHVLAQHRGCTSEKCDALSWFDDPSRVVANLRDHTFDEQVAKYATAWSGPPPRPAVDGAAGPDPASAGTAGFSQRYEFPSSQSIPPVNIMVPEAPAPKGAPNGQSAVPSGDGSPRPATTPVPPRRPTQGRASGATVGSRPSSPHPAAPVAVGETPTDGAATRASSPGQPQ